MNDTAAAIIRGVRPWRDKISRHAEAYDLEPEIVGGICWQESGGMYARPDGSCNPCCFRPEPGFWNRYLPGIKAFVVGSKSKHDDRWYTYPQVYSGSYGLMQVLYQVALERGFDLMFPHDLCDPDVGLEAGCSHLRWLLDRRGRDIERALLGYNGHPSYPAKILGHRAAISTAGVFTRATGITARS